MKKDLDITKRRYSEHILPVPWPFVISRFHTVINYSFNFTTDKSWNCNQSRQLNQSRLLSVCIQLILHYLKIFLEGYFSAREVNIGHF